MNWFILYLADICQAVVDEGGTLFDWVKTLAGVP